MRRKEGGGAARQGERGGLTVTGETYSIDILSYKTEAECEQIVKRRSNKGKSSVPRPEKTPTNRALAARRIDNAP